MTHFITKPDDGQMTVFQLLIENYMDVDFQDMKKCGVHWLQVQLDIIKKLVI
jgi:hypothetical protein